MPGESFDVAAVQHTEPRLQQPHRVMAAVIDKEPKFKFYSDSNYKWGTQYSEAKERFT